MNSIRFATFTTAILLLGLFTTNMHNAAFGDEDSELCERESFSLEEFELVKQGGYDYVKILGGMTVLDHSRPGAPLLPVKYLSIKIPEGFEYSGFSFTHGDNVSFGSQVIPYPTQKPRLFDEEEIFIRPKPEIYDRGDPYPLSPVRFLGIARFRGLATAHFAVYPFQYYPVSKELFFISGVDIKISLVRTCEPNTAPIPVNPESIYWTRCTGGNRLSFAMGEPPVKHLIICSEKYALSFQVLGDWRTKCGLYSRIVTTESIETQYDDPSAEMGNAPEDKIKRCIKDYVENYGTEYVLLAGDTDTIPQKVLQPSTKSTSASKIHSDIYIAGLDEMNWDSNDNGEFGDIKGDLIDIEADVWLGRLSVESVADADTVVEKTLWYEREIPPDNYANRLLLSGVDLFIDGDGKAVQQWKYNNKIKPYWTDVSLTEYHSPDIENEYYGASNNGWVSLLKQGFAFFSHFGHGEPNSWLVADKGTRWYTNCVPYITNSDGLTVIFTGSCSSSRYDWVHDPCMAEVFTRSTVGGAVAYIGSNRVAYVNTPEDDGGWGPRISGHFHLKWHSEGYYRIGEAFWRAKAEEIPAALNDPKSRWTQYTLHLTGDPAMPLWNGDPAEITASVPSQVESSGLFQITGLPENALVCLMKESPAGNLEFYASGPADSSGTWSTCVVETTAGTGSVTVTARNYYPYEAEVQFADTGGSVNNGNADPDKCTVDATTPVLADGVSVSTITISAVDENGNPLAGIPPAEIVVTASGSSNTITGPAAATNSVGQTTATLASTSIGLKEITVTICGTPISDNAEVEFLDPATAPRLEFAVWPENTETGSLLSPQPQVVVKNPDGSICTTGNAAISIAVRPGTGSADATMSGTTSLNTIAGYATFTDLAINEAGTGYQLVASAPGMALAYSECFDILGNDPGLCFPKKKSGGCSLTSGPEKPEDIIGKLIPPILLLFILLLYTRGRGIRKVRWSALAIPGIFLLSFAFLCVGCKKKGSKNGFMPYPPVTGPVVVSAGPSAPSGSVILNNASDVVMLQFSISVSDDLDEDVMISGVGFKASGSGDDSIDVSSARLYRDVDLDSVLDASDPQMGVSEKFATDDGKILFSDLSRKVTTGATETWILVYDFAATAANGATFSVSLMPGEDIIANSASTGEQVTAAGWQINSGVMTIASEVPDPDPADICSLAVLAATPHGPQTGNILISYVILDNDSNSGAIMAEFSIDGGKTFAGATGGPYGDGLTNLATCPEGKGSIFCWDSETDMPNTDSEQVIMKITPQTSLGRGIAGQTETFAVQNNRSVNHAPFAVFNVDKCHGRPTLTVNFDASESYDPDGDNLIYDWQFGTRPQSYSTGVNVSKSYSSLGFYFVTLTVTDSFGCASSAIHPVYVEESSPYADHLHDYIRGTAKIIELEYARPDIARARPVGVTWENRLIWSLEISDRVNVMEDNEPVGLLTGLIHGNEYMGGEVATEAALELVNNYGVTFKHTRWVNSNRIVVVPCVNPDGNKRDQRKNRRNNGGSYGVDVNRNFPFHWSDGIGASTVASAWNYKGPYAASEPETRAIMGLTDGIVPCWSLSYHSYANMVLVPYTAYATQDDDEEFLMNTAGDMAAAMQDEEGQPYGYDHDLGYVSSGTDFDWLYNTWGTTAYLVEIGEDRSEKTDPEKRDVRLAGASPSWRFMLDRAHLSGIRLKATDGETGDPVNAAISFSHLAQSDGEDWHTNRETGIFHKFLLPGDYMVTVESYGYQTQQIPFSVTNETEEINVALVSDGGNHKPNARTSVEKHVVYDDIYITFSSADSTDPDNDSLSYTWDFGDGSAVSHQENPNHKFLDPGTYIVTLTLNDGRGGTDTDLSVICVLP
ncbi:MAG: C25 family cysteine peptidase [Planctomycetota bacterium]|jgi:PKD repeat protein